MMSKNTLQSAAEVRFARSELNDNAGVCVLIDGIQIAVFHLPDETPALYALHNWDPLGKANVLYRGIVGDLNGELVVASPLYKQHFSLHTGRCVEEDVCVPVYEVWLEDDIVVVALRASNPTAQERMSA
ncbi:MAG: nitrite reductase small subunit NirD [Gammaproteobacteria bacterium]